jgi:hypothetical protein
MSHLMKLAEALPDIAEERDESEIEQALGLCSGFAERVTNEPKDRFRAIVIAIPGPYGN